MIGGSCGGAFVVMTAAIGCLVGIGLVIILSSSLILGNLILFMDDDALIRDAPTSDIGDGPLL